MAKSVEDFGMRITEPRRLPKITRSKKFQHVVPSRFNQVAASIEMFCDVKNITVDDLVGRLRVAEDQFEDKIQQITDKAGSG